MLGYKPYHVIDIFQNGVPQNGVPQNGVPHIKPTIEAIGACQTGVGIYSRADFDKWFEGYDSFIGIPSFDLLEELLAAYPSAKFILTTRDPGAWLACMEKTIIPASTVHQFPLSLLNCFDSRMWNRFCLASSLDSTWVYSFFSSGDPRNDEDTV
ncbi:putative NAD dependent epimerase/dehydratase [Seiridium unicorne]|uniref:NAD dependent epimerase/dehydratase n=1 Tax=Seiridium unicorne TaxID=138068 RepID=A0ABR2V8I9_9PEZI